MESLSPYMQTINIRVDCTTFNAYPSSKNVGQKISCLSLGRLFLISDRINWETCRRNNEKQIIEPEPLQPAAPEAFPPLVRPSSRLCFTHNLTATDDSAVKSNADVAMIIDTLWCMSSTKTRVWSCPGSATAGVIDTVENFAICSR